MKLSFFTAVLLQALLATASPFPKHKRTSDVSLRARSPVPFQGPSPNVITPHTVELQRNHRQTRRSNPLGPLRRRYTMNTPFSEFGQEYLGAVLSGGELSAEVEIGTQKFNVIFDTGSSDLWVAGEDYRCFSANFTEQSRDVCGIQTLFEGAPFSGGLIPDRHLFVSYGSQQYALGPIGYDAVTLAGITVAQQELSVANIVSFPGANNASGLIGLAYPALTSAYLGNETAVGQDTNLTVRPYNNLFTNIFQEKLTAPLFSLALQRRTGGVFALGGLPDVPVVPQFSSTPILIVDIGNRGDQIRSTNFTYYTMIADNYVVGPNAADSNATSNFPVIVDSGTTLTDLPAPVVQALYEQFEVEPAVISASGGLYVVPCDTPAAVFGVTVGDQTFYMSPEDLIINDPDFTTGLGGNCPLGVQPSPSEDGPFILGATWLNNVLAVFDIGAAEMRFAPRIPYSVE
ncbi:aspartic peptidase domain-containing protein [Xylogone sp. PMI_703]|nr:aspartic peptidase domain-containing protein [Xylogone sp. PMI_703]